MKFLVDMPLSPDLAQWLRAEGHDAVHAAELSLSLSPDSEILQYATRNGHVVITADLDFPRLLAGLGSTGPGLILLRGGNYSEADSRDCVRRVLMSIAHQELPACVVVVDRERIRRRRLPNLTPPSAERSTASATPPRLRAGIETAAAAAAAPESQ